MKLALLVLAAGLAVMATRLGIYGFDFGLLDVALGHMVHDSTRTLLDATAGGLMGASVGLLYTARNR